MGRAFRIGMSEFIDNDQLWFSKKRRFEIEFFCRLASIADDPTRHQVEPENQRVSFWPRMRLDITDHHIDLLGRCATCRLEH